ncbi:ABC transporter ATP-binding protein [Patescibacteria group bacterium]|nr:MAG: ABC transporter ATP-binding protein [Patescibacteria group bacterium]
MMRPVSNGNAAVELRTLSKRFGGVHALNRLSLGIRRSAITGIIGPNGSGKSTLVNLLTGLLVPTSGTIAIHGLVVPLPLRPSDLPTYGLTRTFQDVRIFEQMSVMDNVLVVLTPRGVCQSLLRRLPHASLTRAQAVLTRVGLWEKRTELASRCSYGQRKLLEIARVLAMDADIYLFDEPFAGLFPEKIKEISGLFRELKAAGKTVVLIEHNMGLIRELSDELIVMDAGELLAQGTADAVLSRRDVVEAYLGD